MIKYIFVTGGVVSGLGKGITAASLGRLLKSRGLKVSAQKLDPYMNVDPGTISPYQHGEVFVTEDGAETDLDLGHYERFMNENLNKYANLTSGKVYYNVLSKERKGDYLGDTVQVIPHITNEIKQFIYANAQTSGCDVLITEIGGTVGDIESQPFIEAIRQVCLEVGRENCLFIHVTYVPYLKASGEHKSKPTQHSVKQLQSYGINPNIIVLRAEEPLDQDIKRKVSLFCNVKSDCVIENLTLDCLYEVPLMLHDSEMDKVVCRELGLNTHQPNLVPWRQLVHRIKTRDKEITIAMVGKYVKLHDAYLSVMEALNHAGFQYGAKINIKWLDSEVLTPYNMEQYLCDVDGILVPGGFGNRGIEGKIAAAQYAREHHIPFLGICLGMQISVIEFARNVCGLKNAHSREFDEVTPYGVIDLMPNQRTITHKGNTMRLGKYPCHLKQGTIIQQLYQETHISERHRHRYEFNNDFIELIEQNGMVVSGKSPDNTIVETIEIKNHPFFLGVQFHPEFKSRPDKPHPLFLGLIKASIENKEGLL